MPVQPTASAQPRLLRQIRRGPRRSLRRPPVIVVGVGDLDHLRELRVRQSALGGRLSFNPLTDVKGWDDIKKFPFFEDDWLRGGPVDRWIPKGLKDKPWYVFETGGTTGIPKSRVVADDFRVLGSLDKHFAVVSVVLQLPVLACWTLVRPISLAAFAACSTLTPARR